jgi:hypothetical protein
MKKEKRVVEKTVVEFIIVKVEGEDEYLIEEEIPFVTKSRFVRDYNENLFVVGGEVSLEDDPTLWVIREIVYNEEYDLNIIYIINRSTVLNISKKK